MLFYVSDSESGKDVTFYVSCLKKKGFVFMFRLYVCLSYDCIGLDGDRGEGNMAVWLY